MLSNTNGGTTTLSTVHAVAGADQARDNGMCLLGCCVTTSQASRQTVAPLSLVSQAMDVVKTLLEARQDKSPQVQSLLQCLQDPAFGLQVCICSVGGVGSTELGNFLTRAGLRCNLLTDQDAIRHSNRPPAQLGPETRVVYLFGDPLACVASHYRRNHAYHQALKTSGGDLRLAEEAFPATLQDYVDRGQDLFGLATHLHNWLQTPTAYDVLFVRYESMFDLGVATALLGYVCGNTKTAKQVAAMAAEFAASKRQRASQVSEQQRQAMYTQLAAEMDALPPVFVRSGKDCTQIPLLQQQGGG